jgi:hypothetical protein
MNIEYNFLFKKNDIMFSLFPTLIYLKGIKGISFHLMWFFFEIKLINPKK